MIEDDIRNDGETIIQDCKNQNGVIYEKLRGLYKENNRLRQQNYRLEAENIRLTNNSFGRIEINSAINSLIKLRDGVKE